MSSQSIWWLKAVFLLQRILFECLPTVPLLQQPPAGCIGAKSRSLQMYELWIIQTSLQSTQNWNRMENPPHNPDCSSFIFHAINYVVYMLNFCHATVCHKRGPKTPCGPWKIYVQPAAHFDVMIFNGKILRGNVSLLCFTVFPEGSFTSYCCYFSSSACSKEDRMQLQILNFPLCWW